MKSYFPFFLMSMVSVLFSLVFVSLSSYVVKFGLTLLETKWRKIINAEKLDKMEKNNAVSVARSPVWLWVSATIVTREKHL